MDTDFITSIIAAITQYVSIPFVISANLLTFVGIKIGENFDKDKIFSCTEKRVVTLIVTLILLILFYFFKVSNLEVLFLSAVLSPFTYSLVIKKILNILGISIYRTSDTEILVETVPEVPEQKNDSNS